MSSTRPFFRDDFASEPPGGHAPYVAVPYAAGQRSGSKCPVLARIPEAVAAPPRHDRRSAADTQHRHLSPDTATPRDVHGAVYRVDPPQSFAPHRSHATSATEPTLPTPYQVTSPSRPAFDDREQLPILIQLAVRTWRFFRPYQSLLRVAAMLALVTAGGMSMALMVGRGLQPKNESANTTTVAIDEIAPNGEDATTGQPVSPGAESAADFHPTRNVEDDPDASTSAFAPTATGPAGATARSGNGLITSSQAIAPGDLKAEQPITKTEQPVTASEANATPALPVYPTTSYPALSLPAGVHGPLPQPRTVDPPQAVARLRGHIEEVQPR